MIDTFFERTSLLKFVSIASVTYVQTGQTNVFKGSLFGCLTTMNMRALSQLAHLHRSVMVVAASIPAAPASRPLKLCSPAAPVPALAIRHPLLIITVKRILLM